MEWNNNGISIMTPALPIVGPITTRITIKEQLAQICSISDAFKEGNHRDSSSELLIIFF